MNTSRAWAVSGLVAGIAGIVGIAASMSITAVYDEKLGGNAPGIYERMQDFVPNIVVFHTATLVGVVLLVVFGAGLRRRLQAQLPGDSLLPDVAYGGLLLTSVAGLMGSALDTEFGSALVQTERVKVVPEVFVFYGHWMGTVPWLWIGAGLTGVAVAVAALRHRAVPRWIGWVGAVLGGVTLAFGISPLQYMAGMFGPLLIAVIAAGFLFGDRNEAIAPVDE
jgi:hypothetical protein